MVFAVFFMLLKESEILPPASRATKNLYMYMQNVC